LGGNAFGWDELQDITQSRLSTDEDNKTFRIQFRLLSFPSIFPGRLL
jgi:hypothetical protein